MRIVHFSDLQLGFRQFQRLTPYGINQREHDVAMAFRAAVDRAIELKPDLVLIGGDVFHNVRPPNTAILFAFQHFSRLVRALPNATVVMVAGNHDLPHASETKCILQLFAPLGVHVVDIAPRRIAFPERDLSVLAIPHTSVALPDLRPEPGVRWNVLLFHGEIEGVIPQQSERPAVTIPAAALAPWDYAALGHYHVHKKLGPRAFYSGALEYSNTNIWGDMLEEREIGVQGKGIIEFDLESGAHTFHHLPTTRRFEDLPSFTARGMSAADLDLRIAAAVESCPSGIDDAVVRLVVRDVPRHIERTLDHTTLRAYKRRALHFHLDTRRPEVLRIQASGAPGRRPSLVDTVRERLRARPLESDIDRDQLVELGLRYLTEADALAAVEARSEPAGPEGPAA